MAFLEKLIGGGVVSAAEGVANVIDRFVETPDERRAAEAIKQKLMMRPAEAQNEINKIEAAHRSVFVAGGRPFILWICGVSLAFYFIPQYALGAWLWTRQMLMSGELAPYPVSADGVVELTLGMLGLGAFRTVEKLTGKAK